MISYLFSNWDCFLRRICNSCNSCCIRTVMCIKFNFKKVLVAKRCRMLFSFSRSYKFLVSLNDNHAGKCKLNAVRSFAIKFSHDSTNPTDFIQKQFGSSKFYWNFLLNDTRQTHVKAVNVVAFVFRASSWNLSIVACLTAIVVELFPTLSSVGVFLQLTAIRI